MNCKYCNETMSLEEKHYCCDNCGATIFIENEEWTNPVVPRNQYMRDSKRRLIKSLKQTREMDNINLNLNMMLHCVLKNQIAIMNFLTDDSNFNQPLQKTLK